MAEVLRFGSLVRHFLEVKFLFGLHYAELRCYFAVSEACWRDLANSDETWWDQLDQEKRNVQKISETLTKNSLVLGTVVKICQDPFFLFWTVSVSVMSEGDRQESTATNSFMPPRLATVSALPARYEDRAGHLTLSWAPVVLVCFDSALNLIGYPFGYYFWMVFGRGYVPRFRILLYRLWTFICKTLHRQRPSRLIESQLWPARFGAEKSKYR